MTTDELLRRLTMKDHARLGPLPIATLAYLHQNGQTSSALLADYFETDMKRIGYALRTLKRAGYIMRTDWECSTGTGLDSRTGNLRTTSHINGVYKITEEFERLL